MKKVLIMDEDYEVCEKLVSLLEGKGFDISYVRNGDEGLRRARGEKPDLLILDAALPGTDGFEICRQVKRDQARSAPRVILMTDVVATDDAVRARRAGADDYCVKTQALSHLVEAVRQVFQHGD